MGVERLELREMGGLGWRGSESLSLRQKEREGRKREKKKNILMEKGERVK